MEQLNNTPSDPLRDALGSVDAGDPQTEQTLKAVSQELKRLHQDLIVQFAQDIARLQAEKSHLVEDIDQLRSQHQQLQVDGYAALDQRQLAQQQAWAKQLAQAIADHLQILLMQRLNQAAANSRQAWGQTIDANRTSDAGNATNDEIYQLLASLETTFSSTFRTLQQELNSYQSSLSQQLSHMHSLEQQGETILAALVQRLREQLQTEENNSARLLPDDRWSTPDREGNEAVGRRSLTQSDPTSQRALDSRLDADSEPPILPPLPS